MRVRSLRKDVEGFVLDANDRAIRADAVVVATGPFQTPIVPSIAGGLREGKSLEQSKEELGYVLAALKTLSSFEVSTQVRASDFQVRVEVNWK